MKVGVVVGLDPETNVLDKFKNCIANGMDNCQLVCWELSSFTDEKADEINKAVEETKMEITALWCGWEGPKAWNFTEGPLLLGLVPSSYRANRIKNLQDGSDFAKKIHVKNLITHVGFLPENPMDTKYHETVAAVRAVLDRCKANGQNFLFETGQETPITLKRIIEDLGKENLGINIDPANLLLYGKANPVDALDIFGEYVMGVHAKDGEYPTDGMNLGEEKALGKGRVNFELFVKKLKEVNYNGTLTIEREISGEEQIRDIKEAQRLLELYINN